MGEPLLPKILDCLTAVWLLLEVPYSKYQGRVFGIGQFSDIVTFLYGPLLPG